MAKKPLYIDCIAGSQLRDTQGEMLSVEGADISDLEQGKGRWNDNHGKGFFNSIGRITEAAKILKAEDCQNERHKYYWDKVKAPFIYAAGYLYDDEDHPNAKAAAAILRNIHKADSPLQLKASVEGGVISRGVKDASLLARTKIHSVALTFTPANNNTLVEPTSLDKSNVDETADMLLIKSVMHLAETNVPSFRHIVRDASASKVENNLNKIASILKSQGIEINLATPSKQEIIKDSLEKKILNNINKINNLIHELKEESVEKGWKENLTGAALSAAIAAAPDVADSPGHVVTPSKSVEQTSAHPRVPASHQEAFRNIAKENPILGAIAYKESSGATRYDHPKVENHHSMHNGHTAGGMFGMMPHTAALMLRRDTELAKKYPELAEAAKNIDANHKQFTDKFNKDPQAAIDFAKSYFERNKNKTINDEMLVHSWNNGLKGSWQKYKDGGMDAISNDQYVKQVIQNLNKFNKVHNLEKALTAGYGGSGQPTARVGGSVLQTESLDDGRTSFKYINCDKCGKEQVYAKYQVKCRNCGQHFSMERLLGTMVPKK